MLEDIINYITYEIYPVKKLKGVVIDKSGMNEIINTFEKQKEYFKNYNFQDAYIFDKIADYYLVKKIVYYSEYVKVIGGNFEIKMKPILDFYKTIKSLYKIKNIIDFYNDDFDFVIEKNHYGLSNVIIKDLPNYIKNLKEEVFNKVVDMFSFFILTNMEIYNKVFKKYNSLYSILFSNKNLEMFSHYVYEEKVLQECVNFCKLENVEYKEIQDKIIKMYVDLANSIIENEDKSKAMRNLILYKSILLFMQKIQYFDYNKYKVMQKKVENFSKQCLIENGIKIKIDIPYDNINSIINDKEISSEMKQIYLTHNLHKGKFVHYSIEVINHKKNIYDMCEATCDVNENFTISVQNNLKYFHLIGSIMFGIYLHNKNHYNDYIFNLRKFIKKVYMFFQIDLDVIQQRLYMWGKDLEQYCKIKDENDPNILYVEETFTDKTVKLIEKILKDIYIVRCEEKRIFCDSEKLTLGKLTNCNEDNPLIDVLSKEFLHYIAYCVGEDVDSNQEHAGLKIRNDIGHVNDVDSNDKHSNACISLMLLTGVVNSLLLYCYDKFKENEKG